MDDRQNAIQKHVYQIRFKEATLIDTCNFECM